MTSLKRGSASCALSFSPFEIPARPHDMTIVWWGKCFVGIAEPV